MADLGAPIITFYSYKGGTGRSMSLANTAWILASNGARVLVVDWDLEAPGLHRFFHPFLPDAELRSSPGLIDFMWDFAMAALDPQVTAESGWHNAFADIQPYAMSVEYRFPGDGTIDLVPAGRQDQLYSTQVTSFDWNNFYEKLGGGGFLQALKRNMRGQYDYVLIDSRTGVSDISGICTVQMPDTLVSCFTLSTQAVDGAAAVAASVQRQRLGDQLRIFPVPMRVEDGEQDKLEASRDYARLKFGQFLWHLSDQERYWGEVEVPYKSFYAYEEILATVGDRPQQLNTILAVTERITGYLTNQRVSALGAAPSEPERRDLLKLFQREKSVPAAGAGLSSGPATRVFICYAFDSPTHFESVRDLWSLLREAGIDARLDQPPAQRSPAWGERQAAELDAADLVIVVASVAYGEASEAEVRRLLRAYLRRPGRFLAVALPDLADGEIPAFVRDTVEPLPLSALTVDGIEPLIRKINRERTAWLRAGDAPAERDTRVRALDALDPKLVTALASLRASVIRQWTSELASRRLFEPSPLDVRWALTDRYSLAADGGRAAFAGTSEDLPAVLLGQSRKRLVILGPSGSGKTSAAARLAISLCETAGPGDPAPLLFSADSWDPHDQDLRSWLAARLEDDYPGLSHDIVGRLIDADLVLPIIDGLDEMPANLRSHAIGQLDQKTLGSGLVLTSRTAEYADLARRTGRPLAGAAVAELLPISAAAAISFIRSGTMSEDRRWEPVFEAIRNDHGSPTAKALSTPLMLVLARDAYSSPATDPAELLQVANDGSLERRLFNDFIEAAYRLDRTDGQNYEAPTARRYLAFIARGMAKNHTRDIAWWQLAGPAAGRYEIPLLLAVTFVPAAALAVAAVDLFHLQRLPISAIAGTLSWGLMIPAALLSPAPRRLGRPARRLESADPRAVLRADRRAALLPPLVALVGSALTLGIIAILGYGREHLGLAGLSAAFLLLVTSALSLAYTAWGRFVIARPWLAARGHLPLRVMAFLDDAYQRGVLRRSGPFYQFRNAQLQDALASGPAVSEPRRPSE